MHTRAIPTAALSILALLSIASCGSGSKNNAPAPCSPGAVSIPGGAGDPCRQDDPKCPAAMGYVAVNTCQMGGAWKTMCDCVPRSSLGGGTGGAGGQQMGAKCGNNIVEMGEECDVGATSAVVPTTSCQAMSKGSGMVMCNAVTCRYDTSMCKTGTLGGGGNGP